MLSLKCVETTGYSSDATNVLADGYTYQQFAGSLKIHNFDGFDKYENVAYPIKNLYEKAKLKYERKNTVEYEIYGGVANACPKYVVANKNQKNAIAYAASQSSPPSPSPLRHPASARWSAARESQD